MLLTLDRGNSTLDCMLHACASERGARRVRLDPADPAAFGAFLDGSEPIRCVGVSVVPGGLDAAATELQRRGLRLELVGRDFHCPLPLDYATPTTLGADRWLGALAAHDAHGRAIVVDCGTATTVNLVEADGTFRGGPIAPGLRALAHGLAQLAPALPVADLVADPVMPPQRSDVAVNTGVILAWCGAIERLVADLLRVARGPATVVLTGGSAAVYLRHGRLRPVPAPDLIHRGLRLLLARQPCAG